MTEKFLMFSNWGPLFNIWPTTKFPHTVSLHTQKQWLLTIYKEKLVCQRFVQIEAKMPDGLIRSDWPFVVYPKSTTDRKRLGRVNHNHNPMIIANGKHISTRIFRLESMDPLSTRSIYFGNFPVGPTWSSQNFPIIYILTEISGIFG